MEKFKRLLFLLLLTLGVAYFIFASFYVPEEIRAERGSLTSIDFADVRHVVFKKHITDKNGVVLVDPSDIKEFIRYINSSEELIDKKRPGIMEKYYVEVVKNEGSIYKVRVVISENNGTYFTLYDRPEYTFEPPPFRNDDIGEFIRKRVASSAAGGF